MDLVNLLEDIVLIYILKNMKNVEEMKMFPMKDTASLKVWVVLVLFVNIQRRT